MVGQTWQEKAEEKRRQVAAKIPESWRLSRNILDGVSEIARIDVRDVPRECGILEPSEVDITENYDATELLAQLAAGRLTSYQVTLAFCKRAAIAQQLISCLTEIFFDRALERARQLDEHLAQTKQPVGPLHGLPISVKDSFNIKGVDTTIGFVSFLDRPPASANAVLIDVLQQLGAVLYVKTNIPQTMMTTDSQNNVFGRVLNPSRLNLTAGGSSGGEGALMAMRGAPIGIGTDIAGSIRIPALCNGTFGFKPSVGRVPYKGQTSASRKGMPGVGPSAGPLTNSARDAEILLRVVLDAPGTRMDETTLGLPWMPSPPKQTLRLGLSVEDPMLPLHPPMLRVLQSTAEKLRAAGHTVIDVTKDLPSAVHGSDTTFSFFNLDPDRTPIRHIDASGEPRVQSLVVSYPPDEEFVKPTLNTVFDLNVARQEFTAQINKVFVDNELDALLCPGYQSCAQPHERYRVPVYTVIANLLDVSSSEDVCGCLEPRS